MALYAALVKDNERVGADRVRLWINPYEDTMVLFVPSHSLLDSDIYNELRPQATRVDYDWTGSFYQFKFMIKKNPTGRRGGPKTTASRRHMRTKYEYCVKKVKRKRAGNAWAICRAQMQRAYGHDAFEAALRNPSRFEKLRAKIVADARRRGYPLKDPSGRAVAAVVGRRKYGAKRFAKMAAAGRRKVRHNAPAPRGFDPLRALGLLP